MYKIVFVDIDGTLIKKDQTVSPETVTTVQRLLAKGIPVILVSARQPDAMSAVSQMIGTTSQPIVSMNGSFILMDNQPVFQSVIDLDWVRRLHGHSPEEGSGLVYYVQREWSAESPSKWTEYEQKKTPVEIRIDTFRNLLQDWSVAQTAPNKIMYMGEEVFVQELQKKLSHSFGDLLNIYPSKPTYLEITKKDASKENAIRFLIERMGIDRSEVIAIGDNFNDYEMIRYAGLGVAMGNAPQEVRQIADLVTDTNEQDGVRKVLDKLIP